MKLGSASLLAGLVLLAIGVFLVGDRSGVITGTIYAAGWILAGFGFLRLLMVGWSGNQWSWPIVSLVAIPLAWALYELARQTVLPDIGVLGTETAPIVSIAAATAIAIIGALRIRDTRTS